MNTIKILDCTLRDGGYANDWLFDKPKSKRIYDLLVKASIDYVEIGYLTNKVVSKDSTLFNNFDDINQMFTGDNIVAMINYGDFDINQICDASDTVLSGIRIAFHKENFIEALEFSKQVIEKGYKVFIQPMITARYSELEINDLIKYVNEIEPYAFYIVDSFGSFREREMASLTKIVNNSLKSTIAIGFHSHNNLQLSFSNSSYLVNEVKNREIIIDSSIYGVGRGAGNLCSEVFADYLNTSFNKEYDVMQILTAYDEIISKMYIENPWGYSIPFVISAKYNCHPNYSEFLDLKKTLKIECIDEIIASIPENKKKQYDEKLIELLYNNYVKQTM